MTTRTAETDRVVSLGDDVVVTAIREPDLERRRRRILKRRVERIQIDDIG